MGNLSEFELIQDSEGVVFTVKVVPGSSKTAVAGVYGGMLKVKVAAPPEKGKANQALIAYLSGKLGVKKNDIIIESGQTSPVKQIRVCNASADVRTLLDLP